MMPLSSVRPARGTVRSKTYQIAVPVGGRSREGFVWTLPIVCGPGMPAVKSGKALGTAPA